MTNNVILREPMDSRTEGNTLKELQDYANTPTITANVEHSSTVEYLISPQVPTKTKYPKRIEQIRNYGINE